MGNAGGRDRGPNQKMFEPKNSFLSRRVRGACFFPDLLDLSEICVEKTTGRLQLWDELIMYRQLVRPPPAALVGVRWPLIMKRLTTTQLLPACYRCCCCRSAADASQLVVPHTHACIMHACSMVGIYMHTRKIRIPGSLVTLAVHHAHPAEVGGSPLQAPFSESHKAAEGVCCCCNRHG